MYKNYIFDFDGTIADSSQCGVIATQHAFKKHNLNIPSKTTIQHYMGIPIEKSFPEMSEQQLSEEALSQLIEDFRAEYEKVENKYLTLFPGIEEILIKLRNQGINMFMVSSKHSEVIDRNLTILGIKDYFTEVVGSDKVDKYKPAPDGVNYIARVHQLNKMETIYIGDAIFDIQMAKAADIASCAVTWGSHSSRELMSQNPTFIVHNVNDLLTEIK
ncbi:HAD family hydrolase [Staphylococcus pettenkoferi]|uniref:HAD family hydrolase n=1 Tax=Staphylococcus pettenkoferi TaxID=170573 RepID=UPI00066E3EB4|nr:HAD family hydrolase [Staphylococcus pettenkoferi]UIK47168.1 HAD family hydrolase [Staphylococcus pettenkoferi]